MFGIGIGRLGRVGARTPAQRAIAILRRYGADAHLYLPGLGAINGLQAGNYLDSAGTTLATVGNPVGLAKDATSSIHASQGTTANKPILRQIAGKYVWEFNGTSNSLALGAPLFQMTDDHCVIAGVKSSTDCAVFAETPSTGTVPMVASMSIISGLATAYWRDDASNMVSITGGSSIINSVTVLAITKQGSAKKLYTNGSQVGATNNTVLGAATIAVANIGMRIYSGTAGLFVTGTLGPVMAIKGTVSDSDLLILERLVSSLTPNGPVF